MLRVRAVLWQSVPTRQSQAASKVSLGSRAPGCLLAATAPAHGGRGHHAITPGLRWREGMSSVLTQLQRRVEPALPGRDYHDSRVFELERRRIFHRKWFFVGRAEQ